MTGKSLLPFSHHCSLPPSHPGLPSTFSPSFSLQFPLPYCLPPSFPSSSHSSPSLTQILLRSYLYLSLPLQLPLPCYLPPSVFLLPSTRLLFSLTSFSLLIPLLPSSSYSSSRACLPSSYLYYPLSLLSSPPVPSTISSIQLPKKPLYQYILSLAFLFLIRQAVHSRVFQMLILDSKQRPRAFPSG